MIQWPPRSTRTATLLPYTSFFASAVCLERPAPAVIVLAKGQVLGRVGRRRQDVWTAVPARCRRKQPIGFLAHRLGNAADLAVGPYNAPVLEVEPAPLERADFGAPCRELE